MNFLSGIYNIMGNTSSEGSSFTTDDSASESAASSVLHQPRTPSRSTSRGSLGSESAGSTMLHQPPRTPSRSTSRGSLGGGSGVGLPVTPQATTPQHEPPDADLSHLTEEERSHIMSVLNRARGIQDREEQRVSDLEDDFSSYSRDVQRRSSDADAAGVTYERCPICHTTELVPDPQPGSANEGLACQDCDRLVCLQCGFYTPAIATDGTAKGKPQLERTQSFSQYEEMRAKPDGASNPITPPRSSREDISLPERFSAAVEQHPKKPQDTPPPSQPVRSASAAPAQSHPPVPPLTKPQPDGKIDTTTAAPSTPRGKSGPQTPPFSSKTATTPPGSLKALETLLKEAESTRKDKKAEEERKRKEEAAKQQGGRIKQSDIKREEYEAEEDDDSDVEIQMDDFPFDLDDQEMMRQLLEMSQPADDGSTTRSMSSMSEDSERELYLAELNEKNQLESDFHDYTSRETDEEYLDASSPEPELTEILEEEEEDDYYDDEMEDVSDPRSKVIAPAPEPRKPRRGQRYESSGPMETLHEESEPPSSSPVKVEQQPPVYSQPPPPGGAPGYTRPAAVQRALERQRQQQQSQQPPQQQPQQQQQQQQQQQRDQSGRPTEKKQDTDRYGRPIEKEKELDKYGNPVDRDKDAVDRYGRPVGKEQELDKYGRPVEKSKELDRYGRPIEKGKDMDKYGRPIEQEKELDRYGRPIEKERELDKAGRPIEKGTELDRYGRPIEKSKELDKYGRPIEKEKEVDRFGRPIEPGKERDRYGRPIEKENELDKYGRPIQKEKEVDKYGRPVERERELDRFGKPIERGKDLDTIGRPIEKEKELDKFGRPMERGIELDKFGKPVVDKGRDVDRHGRPVEREKELDKYGRPIEKEKELDKFGRPIEQQKELDRYGKPIEKEKQQPDKSAQPILKEKVFDRFGRVIEQPETDRRGKPNDKQKEMDKYGRPAEKHKEVDRFGQPIEKTLAETTRELDRFGQPVEKGPVEKPKEVDRFGRPIEKERDVDRFGRPIERGEKEADKFGKPPEKGKELDRFGRPIEKDTQLDKYGRPVEKDKQLDKFGKPIEREKELDKYGRPIDDKSGKPTQHGRPEIDRYGRPIEKEKDLSKFAKDTPERREADRLAGTGSKDKDKGAQWDRKTLDRFGRPIRDKSTDIEKENHRSDETDFDKFGRPVEKKKEPDRYRPPGQRVDKPELDRFGRPVEKDKEPDRHRPPGRVDKPELDRFGRPVEKDKELDRFGRPIDKPKEHETPTPGPRSAKPPEVDRYGRPIMKEKELDRFGRPIDNQKEPDKPTTRTDKIETDRYGRPIVKREPDKPAQPLSRTQETNTLAKPSDVERTKGKTEQKKDPVGKMSDPVKGKQRPGQVDEADSDHYAKVTDIKPPVLDRKAKPSRTEILEAPKGPIIPPIVMMCKPKVETQRARSPSDWSISIDDDEPPPAKLSRITDIMTVRQAPRRAESLEREEMEMMAEKKLRDKKPSPPDVTKVHPAPLQKESGPPKKEAEPLKKGADPLKKEVGPPKRETEQMKRESGPVKKEVDLQKVEPLKKESAPARKGPEPLKKDSGPLKKEVGPQKKEAVPSVKEAVPPAKNINPLSKEIPPKNQTAPAAKEAVPPKKEVGPPKKEGNPEVRPSATERTIDKSKASEKPAAAKQTTSGYVRPSAVERALGRTTQSAPPPSKDVPPPVKVEEKPPRKIQEPPKKEQKPAATSSLFGLFSSVSSTVQKAIESNMMSEPKEEVVQNPKTSPKPSPQPSPKPTPKPRTIEPEPAKEPVKVEPKKDVKKDESGYVRSDAVQRAIERQKREDMDKQKKEAEEKQRMAQQRKEAEEKQRMAQQRKEAEEKQRMAQQRKEAEEKQRMAQQRKEAEEKQRMAQQRKEAEEKQRMAQQRKEAEEKQRMAQQRKEAEEKHRMAQKKEAEEKQRMAQHRKEQKPPQEPSKPTAADRQRPDGSRKRHPEDKRKDAEGLPTIHEKPKREAKEEAKEAKEAANKADKQKPGQKTAEKPDGEEGKQPKRSIASRIQHFEMEAKKQETVTLTESEKGLISSKLSRTSKGFVKRAASVEDDQLGRTHRTDPIRAPKPKRKSFSVDAYESLSDSEIKPRKPKRDASFPPVPTIKPSGSDPKLGKSKGSPTKNGQSVVQAAMQRLLQPPGADDEDVEDKYRSVEDLTKLGNSDEEDDIIDIPQSTNLRMPTPPVQQMQLPPSFSSNNHRKPPSLMKRRGRNRPVMDIPLSPIWDVEVTSPDDEADHPAGDFSSPEYADPSLAEESPLEYDEDEDAILESALRKDTNIIEAADIPESIIDDDDDDDDMLLDDDANISMPDENANLDSLSGYSSRSDERLETLIEELEEETLALESGGGGKSPVEDIIVQEIHKSTESFSRHVASIDINLNRPGYGIIPEIKENPPPKPQPTPPKPLPKPVMQQTKPVTQQPKPVVQPPKLVVQPPKPVVQPPKPAPKPVTQPPKPLPKPVVAPPKPQPAIPPAKPQQTVTPPRKPHVVSEPPKPPVKSVSQHIKHPTQPIKPAVQPIQPITQSTKPITQPTKPITQPTKPTPQPTKPINQPMKPITQPIIPVSQPAVHKPYHFPERSARLTGDGQEDKKPPAPAKKPEKEEPKVISIPKQVIKEEPVMTTMEQIVKAKPPPLALTGSQSSLASHSASIDSDGDSVLDSPRSPDNDLYAFEKPRIASPIRRLGDFSPPIGSPIALRHHKCSPPITPKHFVSHKHFREETFPREISDYSTTDGSTSSTGISPTNKEYKHVLTQMGSSFEEFAHRKDIASRMSPKSRGGHSAFEFPPRHHHDIHHITTKVSSSDAGTSTDSPVDHRSFRYDHAHAHALAHQHTHPSRTQLNASTQFGTTTSAASQTSISDEEKEHPPPRSTSTTRTKILIDAAVDTTFTSPSMSPVSPIHALHAPKTSSIAVGTSPEYSPASSVASLDESARLRSHSLISDGDSSEWGTTMPLSSRASSTGSGASTPERSSSLTSTPHRHPHRYRETSSSSITSSPASRGTTTTSDADITYYRIQTNMMTKAQRDSSLTRASSSDVDSADSDGGTPSSTSSRKVKRRLPSVPAGVLPVTATLGAYDERELEVIDPAKKIEMQKVREMLTKKAAELQLLRYEEELRKLQDESDRLRYERASRRGRHDHRYSMMGGRGRFFNEGSLSDSDISQTGLGDYDTHEFSRFGYGLGLGATSLSMHSLPTGDSSYADDQYRGTVTAKYNLNRHSPPRKVYLSKSEEDIIREIEKQISETTGKDYRAYDRNEIERQVRARYGDYDSDGSTASSHSRSSDLSRAPLELPDYRLRSVRQKLKEELRQVTADKKAELDSTAVTSLTADGAVHHRVRRGAGDGGPSTTTTTSTSLSRAQTVPSKVQSPSSASRSQSSQSLQLTQTTQASSATSPKQRKSTRPKGATDSQPPMFSPIKEDVDIEAEVALRLRREMNGARGLDLGVGIRGQKSEVIGNGRRRRKDNGNGSHTADVERLSKEGELIEKRIREQQEKQFRREIERRKKQMEESARKLEELKARRKMDSAASGGGGQLGKASTSMDTLDGADQTPLGDRNSVQYRSLDIDTVTGRERQRVVPTRDGSMSMSTGHLVERERRIRTDEQGLILPLEDGSPEDIKQKQQERRSRRDMMSDERNIRRTIRSDEYGGRELSPTSYSEYHPRDAGTTTKTSFSVRSRARSASPSTRHTVEFRQAPDHRSLSSDRHRDMSPPARQLADPHHQQQEYPYASPSSRESREQYDQSGKIYNQPGLDPGEYYPVLPRERIETIRREQAKEQQLDPGMTQSLDRRVLMGHGHGHMGHDRLAMSNEELMQSGIEKTKVHEGCIGRDPERVRADSYRDVGSDDMRERHGASIRSRSLPRVSTTTRHETRPVYQEDYYYGDQEYKMKASEWTRRADVDSGDEYDERRARAIYQSVPGGSRHIKQGTQAAIHRNYSVVKTPDCVGRHVSRQEYEFPVKRYRLKRDTHDRSARSNGVGMRIVGGKRQLETNQLVAFVADIYEGGVAEKTDGIHKGDQVLEWCGVALTGKTFEDVQRITQGSEKEIDIVIRCGTNLLDSPRPSRRSSSRRGQQQQEAHQQPLQMQQPQRVTKDMHQPSTSREQQLQQQQQFQQQQQQPFQQQQQQQQQQQLHHQQQLQHQQQQQVHPSRNGVDPKMLSERLEGISKAQYVYSSPSAATATDHTSTPKRKGRDRTKKISGEIQVQLNFDERNHDLSVTLLRARGLAPKDMNGLADPFVKTCLLPGRGSENKRKTRYVPKTLTPEWNQTVIYRNIHPIELGAKILEITVWDFDRFTFNDFMGQVLLDLSDRQWVDNKPRWFTLQDQPANASHEALSPRMLSPVASQSRLPQGGTSPKNHRSRHQGSPRRSRSHVAESGGQSLRSSGYEYSDSDRPSHSSKSSYQEQEEGKTQYTHYHDHPSSEFHFDDFSSKPTVPNGKENVQYPGSRTTSYVQETHKPDVNTTVKVTVTTKRQDGSRPSSLPRDFSADRLHHHDSHQSPVSFERGRSTVRSTYPGSGSSRPGSSRSASSERARLSPSNVRKFGVSPSIFNYTSTDPSRRKDGSSSGSLSPSPQKTSAPSTLKRTTPSPVPRDTKYSTLPSTSTERKGCLARSGHESDEGPRREKASKHVSLSDIEQYEEYTPENVSTTSSLRNGELPNGEEEESPWVKMQMSRSRKSPGKSSRSSKTPKKMIKFSTPSLSELGPSQVLDATTPARTESILYRGDYELTGDLMVKLRRRLEDSSGGAETLFVEILRCRRINYGIKSTDNIPDVYVKGYLLRNDKRISKKKTRICKHSGTDPVFSEVFIFNTTGKALSLQLMLWADGGRFGRNSLLGVCIIWLDGIDFIKCGGETGGWYKLLLSKLHPAKNISP